MLPLISYGPGSLLLRSISRSRTKLVAPLCREITSGLRVSSHFGWNEGKASRVFRCLGQFP